MARYSSRDAGGDEFSANDSADTRHYFLHTFLCPALSGQASFFNEPGSAILVPALDLAFVLRRSDHEISWAVYTISVSKSHLVMAHWLLFSPFSARYSGQSVRCQRRPSRSCRRHLTCRLGVLHLPFPFSDLLLIRSFVVLVGFAQCRFARRRRFVRLAPRPP